MKQKVTREVALKDFERWLNFKNIKGRKREDNENFEQIIVDAIVDGQLTIGDNCHIKFILPEAITNKEGEEVLKELTFLPRIRVRDVNNKMKGVKADDGDGRVVAYISAITQQNTGIITNLFTEDYSVCQSIVMYFL